MMVLEKLSEKYSDDEYYRKHSVKTDDEKVSLHLRVSPEIANELTKVVSVYRSYGIDKKELTKADLGAVILKEYFDNLPDDESTILNLFSKVKAFRDGGVVNE